MTAPRLGKRQYDWGLELTGFGRPFGLGVDAAGRLHVTDMDLHLLMRFDEGLENVEWHDGGAGGWSVVSPVVRLKPDATLPDEVRLKPDTTLPIGAFNGPHSVAFARDGRLFITCYYDAGIHVLTEAGAPLGRLGQGLLTGPASAFFDAAGRLLVAEYAQNSVLVLTPEGELAARLKGSFDRPHMARMLTDGTILVADTWHNRHQQFTAAGDLISADVTAPIACPVAIAPAPDGGWLTTGWGDNCVMAFAANGESRGRLVAPGLHHPYDARYVSDAVVVADSHHARVLILTSPKFH